MQPAHDRTRRPPGLALWIFGPLLGLAAVWVAIMNLPGANCNAQPVADAAEKALLIAVTCVASLAACGAALARLHEMRRAGHWGASPELLLGGLAALVFGVVIVGAAFHVPWLLAVVWVGVLATGASLLGLLVALVTRRDVEQVGPLLPAYLLGAGLACYPVSMLFALAVESGGLC